MQIIENNKFKDKFLATILVARRARDIVDGKPLLTETTEENIVSQAINELEEGRIKAKKH